MTETQPDSAQARLDALWARRDARRIRNARLFLIPYSVFAGLAGTAIGNVLDQGMRWTFTALAVGFLGILSLQWIQPVLLRRGDARDGGA